MEAGATVKVCLGDYVDPLARALMAEATQPRQPSKGVVKVEVHDGCVLISMQAGDLGDLRALLSSYMYLIHAAYSSLRRIEEGSGHRV